MKFSYCRSERMTPIGCPEQINSPFFTDQVSLSVLTLIHPLRSLPLNRSRKERGALLCAVVIAHESSIAGRRLRAAAVIGIQSTRRRRLRFQSNAYFVFCSSRAVVIHADYIRARRQQTS